jgi:dephospho-CoA kinase
VLVGITGNIGSGKTTFCRILKAEGFKVLNGDEISKEILQKEVKEEVILRFGKDILSKEGKIDTGKLGKIVFSSKENLKLLTDVLYPKIEEKIVELKRKNKESLVFLEAAVLIEAKWHYLFDGVVLVFAYRGQRLLRASKRFGLREAIRRDSLQLPYSEKLKYADYLICNTKTPLELKKQALLFLEEFR